MLRALEKRPRGAALAACAQPLDRPGDRRLLVARGAARAGHRPGRAEQPGPTQHVQPPSWEYPFGTDNLGRDVFARTIYAAGIDLMIGLIATYVPLVLGVLLGARRRLPRRLARERRDAGQSTSMVAFPFIVLVIAVIAIVGPGLLGVYIGVTVVGWALYARLTRAGGARAEGAAVRARGDEPRLLAQRGSSSGTSSPT